MKFLLLILIFFPLFTYGQADTLNRNYSERELETAKKHFYVVIDDDNLIKLDSIMLTQFDAQWIEEIKIIKDEKYAGIYGNTPIKAVLIYPKKKYKKKIQRLWELNKNNAILD